MCTCTPSKPTAATPSKKWLRLPIAHGYKYMAITDHSKNLAFANGLDDKRAEEHIKRIRAADEQNDGIKIFAGIEVDILGDGSLDLSDSVLEQMDLVIASVHSHFGQSPEEMTDRLLKAIANPNTSIIGHPTGRLLLRRDAYQFDMDAVLKAAAQAQSRDGAECISRPSRFVRSSFAAGQTARGKDRDQHRFPSHFASRQDSLWHTASPPRLADER